MYAFSEQMVLRGDLPVQHVGASPTGKPHPCHWRPAGGPGRHKMAYRRLFARRVRLSRPFVRHTLTYAICALLAAPSREPTTSPTCPRPGRPRQWSPPPRTRPARPPLAPVGARRTRRSTSSSTASAVYVERVSYDGLWASRACRDGWRGPRAGPSTSVGGLGGRKTAGWSPGRACAP